MTREEAKNWLNKLYARADITDEYGDMEDMQPYEEAVDMAIEALEQEPTDAVQRTSNANKKHIENTLEDAISRQAAIDLIDNMAADASSHGITPRLLPDYVIDGIESLPSVNPQDCDKCEVGNPCLYCKHKFEPQESEEEK